MGPIFCNAVRPILLQNDCWSPEVEEAWMEIFKVLTTIMKKSYDESVNGKKQLELSPTQACFMTFHTLLSPFTTFCQIQFVVDSKNIWMSKCIIEMCYPVHLAICVPETHANHGPTIVSWSFRSGAECSQIFWGIQRYWPEEFATNSVISKPRGQNHEPGQVCCWEFGQSRQVLTSTVDHRCKTCLQLCRGVRKFYMNLQVKTKKLTCFAPMLMTS